MPDQGHGGTQMLVEQKGEGGKVQGAGGGGEEDKGKKEEEEEEEEA